jgi:predicted RND superfamily exporter protein
MKNFWLRIAENILKFKYQILGILVVLTCALGFKASQIQLSYELAKILPKTDERFQLYENFKSKYGEDGNVMVIGLENDQLFSTQEFDSWQSLTQEIKRQPGIKNVLSVTNLPEVYIDSVTNKFATRPIWDTSLPTSKARLDSLQYKLSRLPLFADFIFTKDFNVHLMLITLDQKTINNKNRIQLVKHKKFGRPIFD